MHMNATLTEVDRKVTSVPDMRRNYWTKLDWTVWAVRHLQYSNWYIPTRTFSQRVPPCSCTQSGESPLVLFAPWCY